jgi:solute:Na+ symporter, SSS family
MTTSSFGPWVAVIFSLCLIAMLAIGWRARRRWNSANDYLNASRSLSLWTTALAFLAYNCGSIEVIGMSAMAAQYGVQAMHFYWIGGIPGLVFLSLVIVPVYMRTGANSLPEYLGMRFGPQVRLLNACTALIGTICFAGVALYTLAQVLHVILGWQFLEGGILCAAIVLVYVLAAGARGSIFTSVFQLFVMIAGLTPLLFLTMRAESFDWARRPERWHLWKPLPLVSPHAPLDTLGILLGLGFAISFSYWCTDFVMIQRALAARSVEDARKAPLLAGFGKMGVAFLVVLPGVAAPGLLHGRYSFDQTMPALMMLEYGPVLLALGAAALLAGLMAWLAGNVSGFCALWVGEIYRARLCRGRDEQHYIRAARIAVPVCLVLAQLVAFVTFYFHDMMEFLQLISALFYVPVFAVVVCGMVSRRSSGRGAFAGICGGVAAGLALQAVFSIGIADFGSQMTADFYEAVLSFSAATLTCLSMRKTDVKGLVSSAGGLRDADLWRDLRPSRSVVLLSAALLAVCLLLNAFWW